MDKYKIYFVNYDRLSFILNQNLVQTHVQNMERFSYLTNHVEEISTYLL